MDNHLNAQWVVNALSDETLGFAMAEQDSAPIRRVARLAVVPTMATAISYDCCSTTQTQGPGCCQIEPEGLVADGQPARSRLWPLAA